MYRRKRDAMDPVRSHVDPAARGVHAALRRRDASSAGIRGTDRRLRPSSPPALGCPTARRFPPGASRGAGASHTVAFVADGRAWALDPDDGDLVCLFPVEDAGPFAWGPQGDRVLLNGFEIRGIGGDAPDLPAIDTSVSAFDWGHPLGLAVVFADAKGIPRKRFVDDGRLIRLGSLPRGKYLQVAYHPSGLALAFVVRTTGRSGDLAVDERGRGSPASRVLRSGAPSSPRSRSRRTGGRCGGRPSTRRAIRSSTS